MLSSATSPLGLSAQGLRLAVESSWNMMTHGDAWEGKWRRDWRMEWVASTLHTTSEHGVSSITTADAHTSAASSRLNWHPRRFKWTRPLRRKTKSGVCTCTVPSHFKRSLHCAVNCSASVLTPRGRAVDKSWQWLSQVFPRLVKEPDATLLCSQELVPLDPVRPKMLDFTAIKCSPPAQLPN